MRFDHIGRHGHKTERGADCGKWLKTSHGGPVSSVTRSTNNEVSQYQLARGIRGQRHRPDRGVRLVGCYQIAPVGVTRFRPIGKTHWLTIGQ